MSLSDLVSELNQQLESLEMDHQNIIQVTAMQKHYYIIYMYTYIYIYIIIQVKYIYIVCVYICIYI